MLTVHDLIVDIEGSRVLRGVSFEVKEGELVYLVGRNGAGKTTAFRSIMGFRKVVSGAITFQERSLIGLRPFQIARLGIGFAPEESEVFGELTVAENIALPTWTQAEGEPRASVSAKHTMCFRTCGATSIAAGRRCPAANARCCQSLARSPWGLSSCSSTNLPKACRRWSYRRLSRGCRISGPSGTLYSSPNPTSTTFPILPTGSMSLNAVRLFSPADRKKPDGTLPSAALSRAWARRRSKIEESRGS